MTQNLADWLSSIAISVIIPIYNGEQDLPDLLACLRGQTLNAALGVDRLQYLLVDNNSRDRTWELLTEAAASFPYLQPLREMEIQSSYAARNQGIWAARGEIIVFTDADCRPQSRWLQEMVKPFQDAAVALVVGQLAALPGDHWLERYADSRGILDQRHTLGHPLGAYGQTANLAVRRSALARSGLFRPYLTTGGDADLCWRVQRAGAGTVVFVESAIVLHRHRSTWAGLMEQWRRYGTSNRYLHDLHGAKLQSSPHPKRVSYLLIRWLLKEVPQNLIKILFQAQDWVPLVGTPIDLLCDWVRYRGQQAAVLPEKAQPYPELDL